MWMCVTRYECDCECRWVCVKMKISCWWIDIRTFNVCRLYIMNERHAGDRKCGEQQENRTIRVRQTCSNVTNEHITNLPHLEEMCEKWWWWWWWWWFRAEPIHSLALSVCYFCCCCCSNEWALWSFQNSIERCRGNLKCDSNLMQRTIVTKII